MGRGRTIRRALTTSAVLVLPLLAVYGCAASVPPLPLVVPDSVGAFHIEGDPAAPRGATWTFRGSLDGTTYDVTGVLYKPAGPGPFPAVVLSHGFDGNAAFLAARMAPTMVSWGLVCMAPNYTHASSVATGLPSGAVGASDANVMRAHLAHELLRRLGYVDMTRVAVHGHSMGAYLDVVAMAKYPGDFIVGSETGGGLRPARMMSGPAPAAAELHGMKTPYQMHHGIDDATVPVAYVLHLDTVLTALRVPHQLILYPHKGHLEVRSDSTVLDRIHRWYADHGLFGRERE